MSSFNNESADRLCPEFHPDLPSVLEFHPDLLAWMEEFYPEDASTVAKQDALAHSILKWEGLRPENLNKYRLKPSAYSNLLPVHAGETDKQFAIDSDTCALCQRYAACVDCPLYESRGGVDCCDQTDAEYSEGQLPPFVVWEREHDPEPMIKALQIAKVWSDAS